MSARTPVREQGYAPLADYLGIGDGRSVALIAADGDVDWWGLPDLDSPPVFGALLDPQQGGRISLAPVGDHQVERGYRGDTNVVETVFTTGSGSVRVTDAMNTGVAGRLPWSELGRRVEGLDGEVEMRWSVEPGTALGTLSPWARDTPRGPRAQVGDVVLGVQHDGVGAPEVVDRAVRGSFRTSPGSRGVLAVVATAHEPLHLPEPAQIDRRIDRTVDGWQLWSDTFSWTGPHRDVVLRSALVLKLLLHSPTGSIAAAATTSLPESLTAQKNWDYRYTWLRDTAYTLDAFVRCGLHEEVHAAVAWMLATVERHQNSEDSRNEAKLHPFYRLDGAMPERRRERDVPGWRGVRPVVDGNDASGQRQLGPYGDLFQCVFLCVEDSHVLDARTQRLLADLADQCCDQWQLRDAGMWELPSEEHFTVSKMSCWQALDRAARLAERGELRGDGARWRTEAQRVHDWVQEHCWSSRRQAYSLSAGSEDLDAGVLLGARFGFDRGPRMASTIRAVRDELGSGPWLWRYSGMQAEEGAFLACTFWAVEALALTGAVAQAQALMGEALDRLSDTPMLSEMIDPATGELLGNLPQALSHLALINAASALGETTG